MPAKKVEESSAESGIVDPIFFTITQLHPTPISSKMAENKRWNFLEKKKNGSITNEKKNSKIWNVKILELKTINILLVLVQMTMDICLFSMKTSCHGQNQHCPLTWRERGLM